MMRYSISKWPIPIFSSSEMCKTLHQIIRVDNLAEEFLKRAVLSDRTAEYPLGSRGDVPEFSSGFTQNSQSYVKSATRPVAFLTLL